MAAMLYFALLSCLGADDAGAQGAPESYAEITARLARETAAAYDASPFLELPRDYFARFVRDANAVPGENETVLDASWRVGLEDGASPVAVRMAGHFAEFMEQAMDVRLDTAPLSDGNGQTIVLRELGGGSPGVAESFTITVTADRVEVAGHDAAGLRDGIVRLADQIGLRRAPFLERGEQIYRPRLTVRLGTVPRGGSHRDLVFTGYNAVFSGGGSLFALSNSDAIPELSVRRQPGALEASAAAGAPVHAYGLKTYAFISTREKFPEDDPVFQAHPEIRGARTWRADGEFVLCTEHPLVQQWLEESVRGIFESDPELDGLTLIIGGESFYHCFMRPYGAERGRTNCARCDALGAETVVANLCNRLARAARSAAPDAEVIVWPYSAAHVWSADPDQIGFIEKLEPGVALLTEIEKDEYVEKPGGVRKHLWDYSIDLIGPGERAGAQIAACARAGIPVYLKSEPELGFEAPRLPHIPCMDRWAARAEALASCGAHGAFVFPAFRPNYGTSASELPKHFWWSPAPEPDALLEQFAARLFGADAGPHVREAWRHVSEAIPLMPEIPPYYTGPYYLGPAHPMIADPEKPVPDVFYGHYLFMAEIMDEEGRMTRPAFDTSPRGDVPVFMDYYRRMRDTLENAVAAIKRAEPVTPPEHRLMFDAEAIPIRWFYHTARTQANFYESCQIRDELLAIRELPGADVAKAPALLDRWREVLEDERDNTEAAIPLAEQDVRLDWYYGSDHTLPHNMDMLAAKLELLAYELGTFLPGLAEQLGVDVPDGT